jgi:HK97 family phage major capsid protein
MSKLETLRAKNAELAGHMQAIAAAAEAENRNLKSEEQASFDEHDAAFKSNEEEIARLVRLEEIQARQAALQPRIVQPTDITPQPKAGATGGTGGAIITGGTPVAHSYGNHGFTQGMGEFMMKVRDAGMSGGRRDPRLLVNAVTTYGGEGVAADGAFALPPDFSRQVMDVVMPPDSFLRALNPTPTSSNVLVAPVNENPYWGTSGITSAATAEAGTITASKPALKEVRVTIYKAASLVHLSEEMLSDIPFISGWVVNEMANHLRYTIENWVINGSGEGEPLGIRNSAALIALADVDSDATHIGQGQILTMESNLLPGSGTAFWVASPTVYPAIGTMTTGTGGYPLIQPDMTVPPKRALMGRPFYTSEACPALNTAGDLILVQPGGYLLGIKAGGVQSATTIGMAFDQDLQSFRSTLRAGGAPLLSSKLTRANGSTYASHFVTNVGSKS